MAFYTSGCTCNRSLNLHNPLVRQLSSLSHLDRRGKEREAQRTEGGAPSHTVSDNTKSYLFPIHAAE